jgi:asparagine synthase (glutamine-hydrolysing)
MCGICGFYSKSSSFFDNTIEKMNSAISHRGPNNNGVWQDNDSGIVLGHQRLSIIDLSTAGHQPMKSNSGRFVLTYNGEIYNHLELRRELEIKNPGMKWRSNSDTETLLEGIESWGLEVVLKKIVGMFAFVLWDKKIRTLILAKDRMGEKPLYFGWQGKGINKVFIFGSELKALRAHPEFRGEINRDAIALQLRHSYIPSPYSIYKHIYKLRPGNYLELKENDLKVGLLPNSKPYWSVVDTAVSGVNNLPPLSEKNIKSDLEKLIQSSIKQQMMSDVPLGAFLSGGVDSSTVVALMQKTSSRPIKTFTIGFNEGDYNEANYAKKVAKHLGTDHTEMYVSAEQAMAVIPKLSTIYDEPFSDSSQIPTFLVSELAKKKVTVSLSGDGGDELFCGYNRYIESNNLWKKLRLIPLPFRKRLASLIESISPQTWNKLSKLIPDSNKHSNFGDKMHKGASVLDCKELYDLYYRLVSHWQNPNEIVLNSREPDTLLTSYKPEFPGLDSIQKMMTLDCITYLPDDILVKVDRAAMATSLETRTPFLDHRIVEYAHRIPQSSKLKNGQGKWILREILQKYVPKNLIERPKMGFGVPIDTWLRGPLKDWAESLLSETRLRQEGYLNPDLIRIKWNEHLSEKKNWQYHLWDVLMFQAWYDTNHK